MNPHKFTIGNSIERQESIQRIRLRRIIIWAKHVLLTLQLASYDRILLLRGILKHYVQGRCEPSWMECDGTIRVVHDPATDFT